MKNEGTQAIVAFLHQLYSGRWGNRGTYNDSNIQNHIRNILRLIRPKRINKLSQRTPKRIRQTHNSSSRHSPPIREPKIRIPRRRRQHKRLRQPRQNLSKHNSPKTPMLSRSRSAIPYPIPQQKQHRCRDNRRFRAPAMKCKYYHWRRDNECK